MGFIAKECNRGDCLPALSSHGPLKTLDQPVCVAIQLILFDAVLLKVANQTIFSHFVE